jgi:hypothetical protein
MFGVPVERSRVSANPGGALQPTRWALLEPVFLREYPAEARAVNQVERFLFIRE